MMRGRMGRTGYACDYLRGLLRGIVQGLPPTEGFPSGPIECAEYGCLANDDADCRFIIAPAAHLARQGYKVGRAGHSSVRETLLRLNRQIEDVLEGTKRDPPDGSV